MKKFQFWSISLSTAYHRHISFRLNWLQIAQSMWIFLWKALQVGEKYSFLKKWGPFDSLRYSKKKHIPHSWQVLHIKTTLANGWLICFCLISNTRENGCDEKPQKPSLSNWPRSSALKHSLSRIFLWLASPKTLSDSRSSQPL